MLSSTVPLISLHFQPSRAWPGWSFFWIEGPFTILFLKLFLLKKKNTGQMEGGRDGGKEAAGTGQGLPPSSALSISVPPVFTIC